MRLILKLIAAPLTLFLTVLVAVLLFLFSLSSFLLTAVSGIMALLGVGLFFISYPVGGIVYLGIAFLLSPFGLQAVAGAVITGLNILNLSLRQFITS
ncbi:CD1845 family protein [Gallintestinimicrobium sp.]|uniref:CD1845 family protein n=1 Tax=Gallintestinimicrobium sp. TaxID=2981655 RepID=UPI00399A59C1